MVVRKTIFTLCAAIYCQKFIFEKMQDATVNFISHRSGSVSGSYQSPVRFRFRFLSVTGPVPFPFPPPPRPPSGSRQRAGPATAGGPGPVSPAAGRKPPAQAARERSACRQGWKKPGFFFKPSLVGFLGILGFLGFFWFFGFFIYLPRRESLWVFQFQENF
jgi:hypothetical protein